jgi:hypothetical protein
MHVFAQTNLRLINQLQNSGYRLPSLSSLLQRMSSQCGLFTGRFRASGKTFIAHLVTPVLQLPAILSKTDGPNFSFVIASQSYQRLMEMIAKHLKGDESPKPELVPLLNFLSFMRPGKGAKNEPTRF